MNRLLEINFRNIIFMIITLIWLGEFILFPSPKTDKQGGKDTFYQILITIIAMILLSVILTVLNVGNLKGPMRFYIRSLALLVYISGLTIRYWSLILLGSDFSRGIKVDNKQKLVSTGPYSLLRHPLYLALYLLVLAAVLYIANWVSILFTVIFMFLALNSRIIVEEKYMEEIIGPRYASWKESRYRFLPYIW